MVKVGDSIPNIDLEENGVGNKVNISSMKKGLIIGVPAAFSTFLRPLPKYQSFSYDVYI